MEWISTKDKLPTTNQDVLVFVSETITVSRLGDNGMFRHHSGGSDPYRGHPKFSDTEEYRVTHWMPLPEKPKGEQDE